MYTAAATFIHGLVFLRCVRVSVRTRSMLGYIYIYRRPRPEVDSRLLLENPLEVRSHGPVVSCALAGTLPMLQGTEDTSFTLFTLCSLGFIRRMDVVHPDETHFSPSP